MYSNVKGKARLSKAGCWAESRKGSQPYARWIGGRSAVEGGGGGAAAAAARAYLVSPADE